MASQGKGRERKGMEIIGRKVKGEVQERLQGPATKEQAMIGKESDEGEERKRAREEKERKDMKERKEGEMEGNRDETKLNHKERKYTRRRLGKEIKGRQGRN